MCGLSPIAEAGRTIRMRMLCFSSLFFRRCIAQPLFKANARRTSVPARTKPLERRIEQMNRGASTAGLRVRVDWLRSGAMTSAEVYGSGAGIFEDRVALDLSDSDLRAVVRAIAQSRFAAMPSRFGEADSDFMKMQGRITVDSIASARASCRSIKDRSRSRSRSWQRRSSPSPNAQAEEASRSTACPMRCRSSPPAPFRPRRFALPCSAAMIGPHLPKRGFLLRLRGREAVARAFTTGYGPPRRLVLTDAEFAQLSRRAPRNRSRRVTRNLYAPMYTDFRIDILGRSRDLQARTYSGVSPSTHGARQAAFDALIKQIHALAERVIREGTADHGVGLNHQGTKDTEEGLCDLCAFVVKALP